MDSNPQSTTNVLDAPPPPPGIFGTRIPSTVAFAVGVLLFFLPFAEIKCNNTTMMQNSGVGIAFGKEWKISDKNMFGGMGDSTPSSQHNTTKKDPNAYAIIALALGLLGLVLAIPEARSALSMAMAAGVLAACALVGLWLDLRSDINSSKGDINKAGELGGAAADSIKITLQPTPWFFVSVAALLAAAFFCYRRLQVTKQ